MKKVLVVYTAALCLLGCEKEIKELYPDEKWVWHLEPNCKNATNTIMRIALTDAFRNSSFSEYRLCPLCIDYSTARMIIGEYEKYQEYLMQHENRIILENADGVAMYIPECQYASHKFENYYIYVALGKTLYLLPHDKFVKFKKLSKCTWIFPPYAQTENLDSIVNTFEDLTYLDSIYNAFIRKGFSEDDLGGSFYKFKERLKKPGKIKSFHKWADSNNVELIPFPDFEKAVIECLE